MQIMPVTIAIYNCRTCRHSEDCPDFDMYRRFAIGGVQIIDGPASVRCHHAQHHRRKDYSVDLQGMRLRELLSCFGFIDIGHDDGCLNRCRECARTDCDLHPYHNRSKGFMAQAREAARNGFRQFNEFNKQMRDVKRAMRHTSPHRSGYAADFTHTGDGIYEAHIDATQTQYPYMHVEFEDESTLYTPVHHKKFRRMFGTPDKESQAENVARHIREGRFMDGYRKHLGL
jgi:hypothetical protein